MSVPTPVHPDPLPLIGIVGGTGNLGAALARRWVKAELSVYILENGRLTNPDGSTRAKTINFNAKILLVDPSYRLLTLQFTNGQKLTIKAALNVQLEKMVPGDDVVMRSNEITGITIKKS